MRKALGYIVILTCVAIGFIAPCQADGKTEVEKLVQKEAKLKQENDSLKELLSQLEKVQKSLKKDKSSKEEQIKRDSIRVLELVKVYQSSSIKPVESKLICERDTIRELCDSVKVDSLRIVVIDKQLEQLAEIKKKTAGAEKAFVNDFIQPIIDYCAKPYTEMEDVQLRQFFNMCNEDRYKSDGKVQAQKDNLKKVNENLQEYRRIKKLLEVKTSNVEIDKAVVVAERKQRDNQVSAAQRKQWHELAVLLKTYKSGKVYFKTLVESDNEKWRYDREDEILDQKEIQKLFSDQQRVNSVRKELLSVPYLKSRYKDYENFLMQNPNAHAVEIEQEFGVKTERQ